MAAFSKENKEHIAFWTAILFGTIGAAANLSKDHPLLALVVVACIVIFIVVFVTLPKRRLLAVGVFGLVVFAAFTVLVVTLFYHPASRQSPAATPDLDAAAGSGKPGSDGWSGYQTTPRKDFDDLKLPGE